MDQPSTARGPRGALATLALLLAVSTVRAEIGWPVYGGDAGGTRYSDASRITPSNVGNLTLAWTFRTGELGQGLARRDKLTFEATPILLGHTLYFSTATAKVFAVDAVTGRERWRFDAKIDRGRRYSEMTSRGVAAWTDPLQSRGPCATRIFLGTVDARLIALDAVTGTPCPAFGQGGTVDLSRGVRLVDRGEYEVTSPPAIVRDVVVVGSAIGDNRGTSLELGVVRAFDARTGTLRWSWDPIPRDARIPPDASNPRFDEVDAQHATWTGAANAWSLLSADPETGLVFVPTGSASPDFYGGERPGDDRWADSVVALEAATGRFVWGQQLVHHDVWDYDVASQPVIADLDVPGRGHERVVLQATKTGQLFAFDRDSGRPVFPVVERPVPQGGVAGEQLSPTQPFSSLPPLVPQNKVTPDDAWGLTFWDRGKCAEEIHSLRSDGIFTPPTLRGTLMRPGYGGGANWGSLAFDAAHQLAIAVVMDLPMAATLIPRDGLGAAVDAPGHEKSEFAAMRGTPYGLRREALLSPLGIPCTAPPWGMLVAVDLARGRIAWRVPLGTTRDLAPWPLWYIKGVPAIGGPIVTRGGLVFVGAAIDDYLRAFDVRTGAELWKGRLPGGGQATPMTYEIGGRQYVVIAAGGHGGAGSKINDTLVAFSL